MNWLWHLYDFISLMNANTYNPVKFKSGISDSDKQER